MKRSEILTSREHFENWQLLLVLRQLHLGQSQMHYFYAKELY